MTDHTPARTPRTAAVDSAIAAVRARGERMTTARRAVIEALADHPHQDAEAIAATVSRGESGVHRATIYRTLQSLVELGVLAHTHVPDGATIYHLAVGAHGHTHLQCARCARMFDIPIDWLDELAARVDQRLGFALDPGHAALLGTCRDCQASVRLPDPVHHRPPKKELSRGMTSLQRNQPPNPYDNLPQLPGFELTSTDVTDGAPLRSDQVADEGNTSPQLSWSGAPEGTKSYVVTCFDPDAPTPSGFWHWVLVDVPADVTSLDAGVGAVGASLPGDAFMLKNDGGEAGFMGAAPPEGDVFPHRYFFAVHAVGEESLGIDAEASPAVCSFNLAFKALGRAVIHGTYQH